jgi:hypothetical protein
MCRWSRRRRSCRRTCGAGAPRSFRAGLGGLAWPLGQRAPPRSGRTKRRPTHCSNVPTYVLQAPPPAQRQRSRAQHLGSRLLSRTLAAPLHLRLFGLRSFSSPPVCAVGGGDALRGGGRRCCAARGAAATSANRENKQKLAVAPLVGESRAALIFKAGAVGARGKVKAR